MDEEETWETLYGEIEKVKNQPPKPTSSSSSSATPKKTDHYAGKKLGTLRGEDDSVPLDDPIKERKRREERVKQQDAELLGDLLGGSEATEEAHGSRITAPSKTKMAHILSVATSDAKRLDNIELKNMADCKKFVESIGPAIDKSYAKSPAWLALISGLLPHVLPRMTEVDIQTFKNKLTKLSEAKTVAIKVSQQSKVKSFKNNKDQIVGYKDELQMHYGNADADDDYDYEDGAYLDEYGYENDAKLENEDASGGEAKLENEDTSRGDVKLNKKDDPADFM